MAGNERYDTRLADAHAATERHQGTGLLACLQKRRRTVDGDRLTRLLERDRATVGRSIDARYGEPLHVESILDAFRLPDVFELVEQREGSARPGVALAPVGADRVERTEFELSVTSRELNVAHEVLVLGVQCCEFVGEHHVGFRRSRVDVHDVGQLTAPVHRPQHAHDRSDATAGGDEQDLLRWRIRQREVARRRGQSNDGSRRHGPADEVAREKALGHGLDRDGNALVLPVGRRGK